MAWNEPGGGNKEPWGGNRGEPNPPDLDEVVSQLQERFARLLGGKGGGSEPGDSGGNLGKGIAAVIVGLVLIVWLATGIYIVAPAQRGVVTRLGAYTRMTDPGPHWHIPWPIERVEIKNVDEISSFSHKATMLTQDENIVDVELTVQSRIQDAANYLFQDQDPDKTLRDATETVVRKTIGGSRLDFILTEGRGEVAATIHERVQELMDEYKTGLLVTSVNMQPAKPPDQVKEAFDDAIKAREDKERLENKAEAYANEILPQARGEAARAIADARAYRDRVIAEAKGQTARFLAVLDEYRKAPEVTRERLYLDTIEEVLARNNKVLIDVPDGNSLMYLPLDRLMESSPAPSRPEHLREPIDLSSLRGGNQGSLPPMRDVSRERRSR